MVNICKIKMLQYFLIFFFQSIEINLVKVFKPKIHEIILNKIDIIKY